MRKAASLRKCQRTPFHRSFLPHLFTTPLANIHRPTIYFVQVPVKGAIALRKQGRIHDIISRVYWAGAVTEVRSPFDQMTDQRTDQQTD